MTEDDAVDLHLARMIEGLPVDISTQIRKRACMMELRDMFARYSDLHFAARSLWIVIKTRLLHGLQDACPDHREANDMLIYMRSKLGLAYGCGPALTHYRFVMDYLGKVAWGRAKLTGNDLIDSAQGTSSPADFLRLADLANQFYRGAKAYIIDAGYTSSDDEEDDDSPDGSDRLQQSDDEIYRILRDRRVGFHV